MSLKNGQNGSITSATYKRLLLLYVIGWFKDGIFGRKRLQKEVYFVSKKLSNKPFEYRRWYYGQYSDDVEEVIMELLSLQVISILPLDSGAQGHKFLLRDKNGLKYFQSFLDHISRQDREAADNTLRDFGYLPEQELVDKAYADFKERETKIGDVLFTANMPEKIPVVGVSQEECEELELSLNPRFVGAMSELAKGIETAKIDTSQWKEIA